METVTPNAPTVNPKTNPRQELSGERDLPDALEFADGRQWLEVRCFECGRLAHGDQDETKAAEELQREHSDKFRGHRVNVELFFRECVSTRINETPKEAGNAVVDPQFDRD